VVLYITSVWAKRVTESECMRGWADEEGEEKSRLKFWKVSCEAGWLLVRWSLEPLVLRGKLLDQSKSLLQV